MNTIRLMLLGMSFVTLAGCSTFCQYIPLPILCKPAPTPAPTPVSIVSGATEGWHG